MIKVHMTLEKRAVLSTGIAICEWVCLIALSGAIGAMVLYALGESVTLTDLPTFSVWSILWLGGLITYNNWVYRWARCPSCQSHAMFIKGKGECVHCEAEFLVEDDGIWMAE